MKKFLKYLPLMFVIQLLFIPEMTYSQCDNFDYVYPSGTLVPTTTWQAATAAVAYDNWAGDFAYYSVVQGEQYEWSLCSADGATCSFDSELTLWKDDLLTWMGYSDDYCGDDAKIIWTAPFTGTVVVLISEYWLGNCQSNTTDCILMYRKSTPVSPTVSPTLNVCSYSYYDTGGSGANYTDGQNYVQTITSTNSSCVRAVVNSYNIEEGFDFLAVYDGTNIAAGDFLALLSGPSVVGATSAGGTAFYGLSGSLTFWFKSDNTVNDLGWDFTIDCPENCISPSCIGTDAAADVCSAPTPICDFNGYCGNTYAYTADQPGNLATTFCGSIENNSWLSFVAAETTAKLDVWVPTCVRGQGIQLEVYGTSDCSTFTSYSNCWSPAFQSHGVITATGLTPGDTYFLMIDGYAGDSCEYTFAASSGIIVASAGEDQTLCEGQNVSFTASGGTTFNWTASPADPSLAGQTSNATINVSPTQTTTYSVTVSGLNPACPGVATASAIVNAASASFTGLDPTYCSSDIPVTLVPEPTNGTFSGSGVSGSTFNPSSASTGTNINVTYTYPYSVVTAFSDDFSTNKGWTLGTGWQRGVATYGCPTHPDPILDASPGSDNYILGYQIGGCYENDITAPRWAKSPVINCSSIANTHLSFKRWLGIESSTWDQAYIEVSNNNGSTWTQIYLNPTTSFQDDAWTFQDFDISSYVDGYSLVQVRFGIESDNSFTYSGWNIDDVKVSGVQYNASGTCVSTYTDQTYVYPNPTPSITGTASVCANQTGIQYQLSSSVGGDTYQWSVTGGTISGSSTGTSVTVNWGGAGSGTVSVTETNPGGCTGTATYNVNISTGLSSSVAASPDGNACLGETITLNSTTSGGTAPFTYSWAGSTTYLSSTNVEDPVFTASANGTFNYTVTITDNVGCSSVQSISVNAYNNPSAGITPVTPSVCIGNTLTLNGNPSGGGGSYTHSWTGSTSGFSSTSAVNPVYTPSSAGSYTVTYTVTDVNGCTASDNETITVNAQPSANIIPNNPSICANATVNLNAQPSGGSGSWSTHNWTGDVGPLSAYDVFNPTFQTGTAGSYVLTYTVTDSKGCQGTDDVTITVNANDDASFSYPASTFCQTGSDPTPTITGTPGGAFSASSGSLSLNTSTGKIDLSASTVGSYTVTYTTTGTCPASSNLTITITTAPDAQFTYSSPFCEGSSNPLPSHTTGSDGIYSCSNANLVFVSTNTGQVNLTASIPGTYDIVNTINVAGCSSSTQTQTITINDAPDVAVTPDPIELCLGTSLNLGGTITGGTSPFTHAWTGNTSGFSSTSINNPVYTPSTAGSFNVTYTVTDANGCMGSDISPIVVNGPPTAGITPASPFACSGADINLSGNSSSGTSAITTHLWTGSNLNTYNTESVTFNSSTSGQYQLIYQVTDAENCSVSDTVIVTVYENPQIENLNSSYDGCAGEGIYLDGTATAGSGTITDYLWLGDFGPLSSSTSATPTFTTNTAGTYNLTYTVTDAYSCSASQAVQILINSNPATTILPDPANACVGVDLTLDGNPTGGQTPYMHGWSGDVTALNGSISVQSPVFNADAAGNYGLQYTVTDANGCSSTDVVTVIVYNNPTVSIKPDPGTVCSGVNLPLDGQPSAGSSLITSHLWTGDTYPLNSTTISNPMFNATTDSIYTLVYTVEDQKGCIASDTVLVEVNPLPSVTIAPASPQACENEDILLTANSTGGSGNYVDHTWEGDDAGLSAGDIPNPVFNYTEGTYNLTYTVVDDNNCSATTSVQILINPLPELAGSSVDANCGASDGSATITATGATSPYSYAWETLETTQTITNVPAEFYSVTVSDANGCSETEIIEVSNAGAGIPTASLVEAIDCNSSSTGSITVSMIGGTPDFTYQWYNTTGTLVATSDTATDLPAGAYEIIVTDALNCVGSDTITLMQPSPVSALIKPTNISCPGNDDGIVEVESSGGTGNHSYQWDDANNSVSSTVSGLPAGTYNVTVSDANGCTVVISSTLTEPQAMDLSFINVNNVLCYGGSTGSVTASVSGGSSPYSYSWSNGSSGSTIANLIAGTYITTIHDNNGCSATDTIEITQPNIIILSSTVVDEMCGMANGNATVIVSGGMSPFSFLWDFTTLAQTTQTAINLDAGQYSVTVTDANNCKAYLTGINIANIASGQAFISDTGLISCYGADDGSLEVMMSGGTAPYSYHWSHDSLENSSAIADLGPGTYFVTITDANGCTAKTSGQLSEPDILVIHATTGDIKCDGYDNGYIILLVENGTQPYNYTWSGDITTPGSDVQSGLDQGEYGVTVTDANGCFETDTFHIAEPLDLEVSVTIIQDVTCFGGSDAIAHAEVSGGITPYAIEWHASTSGNQTGSDAIGLLADETISVTVTDANECKEISSGKPIGPDEIVLVDSATVVTPTGCEGSSDGSIKLGIVGGTQPYTYHWSTGEVSTSHLHENLPAEIHHVTVTDAHGCEFDTIFVVGSTPEDCLNIPDAVTPNGDGANDTWAIDYIWLYDEISIEIYNRWGDIVYDFNGTGPRYAEESNQFDGTNKNGKLLPHGAYAFILRFITQDHLKPITGTVTIIH